VGKREEELSEATERARTRLQHWSQQYVNAEPIVISQYLLFRSFIQEAHLYALLDQLSTGKMEVAELQKRFIDHANRIADELQHKLAMAGSRVITPHKGGTVH
jgi:hypothetical protein